MHLVICAQKIAMSVSDNSIKKGFRYDSLEEYL